MDRARWMAAATILLLAGGGCPTANVRQEAQVEVSGDAAMEKKEDATTMDDKDEVDAAADAYLEASAEEEAAVTEEERDVNALTETDAELNAFGQTYDKNEF